MTIVADPPLHPQTLLGAIDRGARDAANDVRTRTVPAVRAALPARTGRARRGVTGRVGRTPTGYKIEVAGTSRVRYPNGASAKQVIGWLHTGTGVFGPRHRPITPRKASAFRLPGGYFAESIPGYRGRDYFAHAASRLSGVVYRTLEDGARAASRAVEELIG